MNSHSEIKEQSNSFIRAAFAVAFIIFLYTIFCLFFIAEVIIPQF